MFKTFLLAIALVGIAVLLLGFRIFFVKNGKFPNSHVGKNKYLSEKGIHCTQTQDKEAQKNQNNIKSN
jgi:hypothetical protein